MPSHSRRGRPVLAVAVALALQACASSPSPAQSCQTTAECPASARCISNSCVANAAPTADVALPPGTLQTNVLLAFDASASSDADAGDAISSFAWTFHSVTAPCPPPVVAGTGPQAHVRFACAGSYTVEVTAHDQMSASGSVTKSFDVAAYAGPAFVIVGTDVAVDHACTAGPAHCAPVSGTVQLTSSAPDFAPGAVSFQWTVTPPADRPLDANRRVTFSPGAGSASPTVLIETDGQAISGDWLFQVQVTDAAGVIGTGTTRVSITNRPPVVEATVPSSVDHAFDGGQLTANGQVAVTVTDPDGDPIAARSVQWHHTGDGAGSLFSGVDLGNHVTFEVAVPYSTRADGAHLIGTAERTIDFEVTDVNGSQVVRSWPVVIGNRPPVLLGSIASGVPHTFDPVASAYVASAPMATWADPDGDPLEWEPSVPTGDPQCPTVIVQNGVAHAACSMPFSGVPAVAQFAGTHTLVHTVRDPWTDSVQAPPMAFYILNAPPTLTTTSVTVTSYCNYGGCCRSSPEGCEAIGASAAAGSETVGVAWTDPDGDPLSITLAAGGSITPTPPFACTASGCEVPLTLAATSICEVRTTTLPSTGTDGLATTTGSLVVERICGN